MYFLSYITGNITIETYRYIYDVMLDDWRYYHGEFTGILGHE